MKPYRRLVENVGMLPRLPRQMRLRLARNESRVDGLTRSCFAIGNTASNVITQKRWDAIGQMESLA